METKTYDVRYLGKREVADRTMEFTVERPPGLEIRAGQFGDIVLPCPEGTPKMERMHGFSFVNAPCEANIVVATRMRGTPFKRRFAETPDGTMVQLIAPFGRFTLHDDDKTPAVFIAGGIGITPVRANVVQAINDRRAQPITVLYANRTPADAPYTDEFKALAATHTNLTFVPVYTQAVDGDSSVERGHVDAAMIRRHVPDLAAPKYYVVGPEGMVKAMAALLLGAGVDKSHIQTEKFEGY